MIFLSVIKTEIQDFELKIAEPEDMDNLFKFICDFAEYEKLRDEVKASPQSLGKAIFEEKVVKCLIPQYKGKSIGYCLYFNNFSSFEGKKGLYLEDVYIVPEFRGKGFGEKILEYLAKEAVETGCTRFDWCCLDWNTPSLDFYKSLGAMIMEGWLILRLDSEKLISLADKF